MPYIIEKTFNSEIFTKVGNPTITADGIASGFSNSNYLQINSNISTYNSLVVLSPIFQYRNDYENTREEYLTGNNIRFSTWRTRPSCKVNIGGTFKDVNGSIGTLVFNHRYQYKLEAINNTITFYFKDIDFDTDWQIGNSITGIIDNFNSIFIGINNVNSNYYWLQSKLDLKQFSITVDGKIVLNGTTSKEVYVLPSIQEIKDYYSNTLIIQYNGKPKAKATIEMLVDLIYDNVILNQIQEAFDWKTAVGKQLDIIGQWVGVSRIYQQNNISGKTYLSYPGWDDETDTLQHGYSDYTTFNSNTGNDLTYKELETLEANLSDDDYRTVIGLKIIKNNINHTAKNIDDAIWEYFNGKVYTTWSDYKITYHYPAELTTIIEVCNAKNVLLAPIGVNINLLQTE